MTNSDPVLELVKSVGVMKPASVKKENAKQVAKLESLLEDPEYAVEEKIDGVHYKMLGHRFFSKDNHERTDNYPHLAEFFKALKMSNLILDGEMNYPGKTSQYCTHVTGALPASAVQFQKQNGYIHFTIFDILRTPKAQWTLRNTYKERRKLLEYFYNTFIVGTEMENYIHITEVRYSNKKEYVDQLLAEGKEGGVLKRLDSQYQMGKKPMWQWMKIKQSDDADLVIMGFEPPKKLYTGKDVDNWPFWIEEHGAPVPVTENYHRGWIGAITLGAYVDGVLTKICTASGMTQADRKDMSENPDAYINRVARIGYMERTSDGYPRHPVYNGLHEDKQPEECEWEF